MKTRAIPTLLLTLLLSMTACAPLQATVTLNGKSLLPTETTTETTTETNSAADANPAPSTPEESAATQGGAEQSDATSPATPDADLLAALLSAKLDLSAAGEEFADIQLKGGVWQGEPYQEGAASRPMAHLYSDDTGQPVTALGDLDGDNTNELAAVLAVELGGSGTFMHLIVLTVQDGPTLIQLATAELGDRTKIEQITLGAGKIAVEALVVGEKDPLCCPRTEKTFHFAWADDSLQPVADESGVGPGEGEQISYEDLIANATTQEGIFTVHQLKDQWYLEIPKDLLGRDFYWYSELSQVSPDLGTLGVGLGAIGEKMVTFEQVGQRIVVNELSSVVGKRGAPTADGSLDRAVAESALPTVLLLLPIVAESPAGAPVVDIGTPLAADLNEFSVANLFLFTGLTVMADPLRSYVERIDAYPNNMGISTLLTLGVTPAPLDFGEGMLLPMPTTSQSVLVRHNLTLLPETPMTSRYADPRVGYFTISYEDYSGVRDPDVETRELITRFRLEKKDPEADLSAPVQPIVFYISREVPERWRDYIKQGVEDWQPAFAAAGFKDAIIAKDAPSPAEDPTWDPSDTRYSLIRWVAQPVANAFGPSTVDPRSGEILSAHIQIFADLLEIIEQWYFVQASAVDERARTLPMDDEILGEALRYVVAHEVGHALGLRHNHKASQAYTIEQLRDPDFTDEHGVGASIMSYGRFNYVAQPGDGVTNLIPDLGAYDIFAIEWGYTPIPEAQSAADERVTLDKWAARQLDEPWLRFGGEDWPSLFDPTVVTENIGDDRIEATRLGIKNLERVMGYLAASSTSLGSDFTQLEANYWTILLQRFFWLDSVVKIIGGVEETRTLAGRGDVQFHRVPKAEQQAALQFVLENLQTPSGFLPAPILDQLTPIGGPSLLEMFQYFLLYELLSPDRLLRLVEGEQLGTDAYLLIDYLADVQDGLFAELNAAAPQIDPMRRALQRSYLDLLEEQMTTGWTGDVRAAARWNLQKLAEAIKAAEAKSSDTTTAAHLADLHNQIATILDGSEQSGQPGL
ncbi:MAG: DUF5117 domain-containing protein [Caldilinea sp. CFX5]|nr:DUF5117 domain-containing protein [Caldilinea sp. CFX5]